MNDPHGCHKLDDARLVQLCGEGHRIALESLINRYKQRVYNIALHFVDPQFAEDVVMETFSVVCKNIDRLKDRERFGAWVSGIAVNLCKLHLRRQYRIEQVEVPLVQAQKSMDDSLFETVTERINDELLYQELTMLPIKQRIPLVLHYFGDIPYTDIAKQMGIPLPTLKYRAYQGLATLEKRLSSKLSEDSPTSVNHD